MEPTLSVFVPAYNAAATLRSIIERIDDSDGRIPVVKRNSPTILNAALNSVEDRRRSRRSGGTAGRRGVGLPA